MNRLKEKVLRHILEFKERYLIILYFLTLPVLVLYNSFGKGYLITLDMVFTPYMKYIQDPNYFDPTNGLVYRILEFLSKLIPGYFIQQFILFTTLFLIGYLAYLAFRLLLPKFSKKNALLAGTIYLWNPFVYSRIMAGHWQFLIGYALLPIIFYLTFQAITRPTKTNSLLIISTTLIGSLISIHHIVIYTIIFTIILITYFFYHRKNPKILSRSLKQSMYFYIAIFVFILTLLLLSPTISNYYFNDQDLVNFASNPDPQFGLFFNLISLYGFWAEDTIMNLPKESIVVWWIISITTNILLVYAILKNKLKTQNILFKSLCLITFLGLILSLGRFTFMEGFWQLFYTELPLLKGFREPQKFLELFILGLAFFISTLKFNRISLLILLITIFTYTFTLFGLNGQLKPIEEDYFQSIVDQKAIINTTDNTEILDIGNNYIYLQKNNRQVYNFIRNL